MEGKLAILKENIEVLSFFHQVEVLRILNEKNSSILNENKNGVFINLTSVDNETINKLQTYLKYVSKQESQKALQQLQASCVCRSYPRRLLPNWRMVTFDETSLFQSKHN